MLWRGQRGRIAQVNGSTHKQLQAIRDSEGKFRMCFTEMCFDKLLLKVRGF